MQTRQRVLEYLDSMGYEYQITEHEAVFTVEAMKQHKLPQGALIVKNLFLRDQSGKRHFLILLAQDKKTDLKTLQAAIDSKGLKFASAERLQKYLGLESGSVGPMGLLNDTGKQVEVIVDNELAKWPLLGIHPNDNTATVWLSYPALDKLVKELAGSVAYLDL